MLTSREAGNSVAGLLGSTVMALSGIQPWQQHLGWLLGIVVAAYTIYNAHLSSRIKRLKADQIARHQCNCGNEVDEDSRA